MAMESSFGRWLQRRRKALDLTQDELAQRVGCAAETLRKIEADARRPSRQIAERLAHALELREAEHAAFIRAARAELAVDQLVSPTQGVTPPALVPAAALPSGTVTFLFTDIERSTQLWEQHPEAMQVGLARHDAMLRHAIATHQGIVVKSTGDGLHAVFGRAPDALAAAVAGQRALHTEGWGATGPLRVRMALHTGVAEERDGDYFGPALNRVARLLAVGYGGQVLLSRATQEIVHDHVPAGVVLRDLGEHWLKDLTRPEHIVQLIAPDLPDDFPPLKTRDPHRINLPAQLTPLIGREAEVTRVCALLQRPDVRLVTLTGPGGVGKTRLGLQVAAQLLDAFTDGAHFVDLAPISDPTLVRTTIAQTLGVQERGQRSFLESLKEYLRDKHLLLLLDNFEQVLEAAPDIAELLAAAPRLNVLVTSRAVLHLRGEKEVAVPPLALPDPAHLPPLEHLAQYAAVALFMDRAQDTQPVFTVTNTTAPTVVAICHRLDGLPLAIELAAARIKLFPLAALLGRLERRLPLLTAGARDVPARQQTLRNTIDWSYELLNTDEQTLFRRIAVFVGGCTLEAAEAVTTLNVPTARPEPAEEFERSNVLDGLASLVDKSLLQCTEVLDSEPHFTMLETIREYALERLEAIGEADAIRQQHAAYYLALAEAAEPKLHGEEQQIWLRRLETEQANLRAALTWSQTSVSEAALGLRLAGALGWFWLMRGYLGEGQGWLAGILARPASLEPSLARARALNRAGLLAARQGDHAIARALQEECLAISQALGDAAHRAWALAGLGEVALAQLDRTRAAAHYEESVALLRALGDRWGSAWALLGLAETVCDQGDHARAAALYEESLTLFRICGDRWQCAWAIDGLADVAHRRGDHARATALYEESLALLRDFGDRPGSAWILLNLSEVAQDQEDHVRAAKLLEESLTLYRELGDKASMADALAGLGARALTRGDYGRAMTLYEESLVLSRELGDQASIARALSGLGTWALMQGEYERALALFEEGLALYRELGDQSGIATTQAGMGEVVREQGDDRRAMTLFEESLALYRELGDQAGIAAAQAGMGEVVREQGNDRRALVLFEDSLARYRERGSRFGSAGVLICLAEVALDQGDPVRAQAFYKESLTVFREWRSKLRIVWCLEGLAGVAVAQSQPARAVRLFGAAEVLRHRMGTPLPPSKQADYERCVALTRARLDEATFTSAWAEGRAMTLEQAIDYALGTTAALPDG